MVAEQEFVHNRNDGRNWAVIKLYRLGPTSKARLMVVVVYAPNPMSGSAGVGPLVDRIGETLNRPFHGKNKLRPPPRRPRFVGHQTPGEQARHFDPTVTSHSP